MSLSNFLFLFVDMHVIFCPICRSILDFNFGGKLENRQFTFSAISIMSTFAKFDDDILPRYTLKFAVWVSFFDIFFIFKMITTAHAQKIDFIFIIFHKLSNKPKTEKVRPKMSKWPSRGYCLKTGPLYLSFGSFLTFLHHSIEYIERYLLWKFHKKSKEKLIKCATEVARLHKVSYKVAHKIGHLRKFNRAREIELNVFTA